MEKPTIKKRKYTKRVITVQSVTKQAIQLRRDIHTLQRNLNRTLRIAGIKLKNL